MAGKSPKAGIDVTVNERPAVEGLKRLSREFATTAVSINQSMEIAGKVFGALQAGVSSVVSVMGDAVRAAMEVERVERRAFAAMQTRAGMAREEFDALGALNDQRERQLNIDADEQLQLQGTLAALGVRKEALNAATEATIGLAEVTGQGLAEAGKKVAQVLGGNVNALKELGIRASSAADAQRQLQDLFVLATAQADTLETRVAAVGHAYGSMTETIGGLVTSSAELKKGLDAVTTALVEVNAYLSSPAGKQAAREFFGVMLELASDTIDSVLGVYRLIQELRGEGDRQSAMSRAGGAMSLLGEVQPGMLAWRAFTGQVEESKAAIDAAYDQMLGRGAGGADAPIIATIEQLSNRLRQAAADARQAAEPALLHADGTPYGSKPGDKGYVPPRSGGGGAAARRKAAEEMGPGISIQFDDMFGESEIEAERQRALKERTELMKANAWQNRYELGSVELDAERANFERLMALKQELHERGLDVSNVQSEDKLKQIRAENDTARLLVEQGASIVASSISGMIADIASGAAGADDYFKKFVGGMITSLGTMLVNVGTAAVVFGTLSLIPGLQGITGGPGIGIGAGAAAMVVGAGMIAAGTAIGGGSGGASARAPAPGRGAGGGSMPRSPSSSMGDVVPRGFQGLAMGGAAPYTVNISFSGVVGDERRAARMIQDVLRRGG